ncbi:hypothetical protein [Streptomyces sp. SID8352]|nr:hypothetical protein [Streptomyces sp. SID8352]
MTRGPARREERHAMKAAVVRKFGEPLVIEELPDVFGLTGPG